VLGAHPRAAAPLDRSCQERAQLWAGPGWIPARAGLTVDGNPVKLTSHEYRLLSYLMHHAGRVISRTELVEHLYDRISTGIRTPSKCRGAHRKKLGVEVIQTVRGLGYLLAPPGDGALIP